MEDCRPAQPRDGVDNSWRDRARLPLENKWFPIVVIEPMHCSIKLPGLSIGLKWGWLRQA